MNDPIFRNFDKSLERRKRMAFTIELAIKESPQDVKKLLEVVRDVYQGGRISHIWDLIAVLAGAERGFGNDWYFIALETLTRMDKENT